VVQSVNRPNRPAGLTLAFDGTAYGIAWSEKRPAAPGSDGQGSEEVFFARLSYDGTLLGDVQQVTDDGHRSYGPELLWSNNRYALTWRQDHGSAQALHFALLQRQGLIAAPGRQTLHPVPVEGSASDAEQWEAGPASMVSDGEGFAVVWVGSRRDDRMEPTHELFFVRLSPEGLRREEVLQLTERSAVTTSSWPPSYPPGAPSIAFDGSTYHVYWSDHIPEEGRYLLHVSQLGARYPDRPIQSASTIMASLPGTRQTALTWDGSKLVAAWQRGHANQGTQTWMTDLYWSPLDEEGQPLSPQRVSLGSSSGSAAEPVLASVLGGPSFLVWQAEPDDQPALFWQRLDPSAERLPDKERVLLVGHGGAPALAWHDGLLAVAWAHSAPQGGGTLFFARLGGCE
jgi:hypothetical protein